jgi:hypothetical protein
LGQKKCKITKNKQEMSHLKIYITIGYFLLVAISVSTAQIQTIGKEPFRNVQFFTPVHEFYDDGAMLYRYSAYRITCIDGNPLLNVPESINRPHTIQIMPGKYIVEVALNGVKERFGVEIDESCFQQFRLYKDSKNTETDSLQIFRPRIDDYMFGFRK